MPGTQNLQNSQNNYNLNNVNNTLKYLNSREMLADYILSTLGAPILSIEVTPTQISNHIDTAIQKFSSFAMGGDTPTKLTFDLIPGVSTYILDNSVESVVTVRTISSNFSVSFPNFVALTPTELVAMPLSMTGESPNLSNIFGIMSTMSALETLFNVEPNYDYNSNSKVLEFFDITPSKHSKVLIEAFVMYTPKKYDMIFNHQWVKEYALNLVKLQWGNNVGKYTTTTINGASINYERIISEANAELSRLDEELLTRWSKPLGIHRG